MAKATSVISLDPIDRKKRKGIFARLLVTRWSGGKKIKKMDAYGHYMFCGAQGTGKTASALWYGEKLAKKYKKKKKKVIFYSNIGVGREIKKESILDTIDAFDPTANEVRIVILDEVHTYFPKGNADKETKKIQSDLTTIFSQLRKRSTYIISTAQVYGRLEKSLREQCLYMIDCHTNGRNKLVNDFIPEKEIMCDELGRWAGNPSKIYVHGLSKLSYDTKKIIRD